MHRLTGADSISPLQAIKQREVALRQRVKEARQQAEARIRAAQVEGEQIIAQADQAGRAEAEACYQQGVNQARQQAEAIVKAAHQDAAALRCQAQARLDDVARQISTLVLPEDMSLKEKTLEIVKP
jgi:vacuolar-type H+-ATPase subunit H